MPSTVKSRSKGCMHINLLAWAHLGFSGLLRFRRPSRQWLPTVGYCLTSTLWDSSHRCAHRSSKCRLTLHEDSFPGESRSKADNWRKHLYFPVACGKHQPPLALIFTSRFCCSWILFKDLGTFYTFFSIFYIISYLSRFFWIYSTLMIS